MKGDPWLLTKSISSCLNSVWNERGYGEEAWDHTHTHTQRDLCPSKKIWARILPTQIPISDTRIQDPLRWNWSILFQVSINQKSSGMNTFCPCKVGEKRMA